MNIENTEDREYLEQIGEADITGRGPAVDEETGSAKKRGWEIPTWSREDPKAKWSLDLH